MSSATGTANLTVQPGTLTITTTSLPNGAVSSAYSQTLAASGGTPPYMWSLASGALPVGLTLNPSGAITGTPTTTGTSTFTAQVTAGASATKQFTITISTAPPSTLSIWLPSTVPGVVDGGPDSAVELGVKFRSDVAGTITGIRFYKAMANTGTHVANLWSSTGTLLATATFSGETASGWQQVNFTPPDRDHPNTSSMSPRTIRTWAIIV